MPPRRSTRAPRQITGEFRIGGQEHFYLEGQVALAIPGEDGDMLVHSSTQHPTEVQHVVAHVLGARTHNAVTVEVRRMGGGFGGKESQATQWAALAALGALEDRPAVQDAARPRRRHDHDRQAPRLPRRLHASASARTACSARSTSTLRGALRLFGGPVARRRRPRRCSMPTTPISIRRCRILTRRHADQHRVQHRLPRLRRPAGHALRRADDGPHRLCDSAAIRSMCARPISTAAPAATARPTACGSRTTSSPSSSATSSGPATTATRRKEIAELQRHRARS